MKFTDSYRLMGLPATATAEEVKTAYRHLARKYHPDVSKEPGTLTRFTDIGEAYEVLPDGDGPTSWRFSETVVLRAKKALRLHRDLGLEGQGLALALEPLDEIDRLRGLVAWQRANDETRC